MACHAAHVLHAGQAKGQVIPLPVVDCHYGAAIKLFWWAIYAFLALALAADIRQNEA
ncbi:hypothetical protein AA18889_1011 [Acetobacter senegalensis DSM 18889]|nr:hypothetical protein AA18889_1011 [Acetobacter senegalensis DSM 18889]